MTEEQLNAAFDARAESRKAVAFHARLKPGCEMHLVAIREGFSPQARTFECEAVDDAIDWIAVRQGISGIYFHVANLKPGVRNVKAKKGDVASTSLLHVDLDYPEAVDVLRGFQPAPSLTIFSGGGAPCLLVHQKADDGPGPRGADQCRPGPCSWG